MATTFHPFPRLPPELRAQIWGLAAGPRILHVRIAEKSNHPLVNRYGSGYTSPMPPPAVMHVCKESRQHAPYQKAFFTTLPGNSEAQYIWANFQEDMICVADYRVEWLAPHEADIRRLRIIVPLGYLGDSLSESFTRFEKMKPFIALRELHLAIGEYFLAWGSTVGGTGYSPCHGENVKFLDLHTGLLLTGPQLEMASNWADQDGGRVLSMDDFDEELQYAVDNYPGLNLQELAEID